MRRTILLRVLFLLACPLFTAILPASSHADTAPDDLMRRAEAEFNVGHGREAIALFEQAATAFSAAGNMAGRMVALDRLGTTAKLTGDNARATAALAEAVDLARHAGHESVPEVLAAYRAVEVDAVTKLAEVAPLAGDLPHAIAANRDVLARAEAAKDPQTGALAAARLGSALLKSKQLQPAVTSFRRAAELFHATGQRPDEGLALKYLGDSLTASEQYLAAADAFQQAADIAHATGDKGREANALDGLGRARYYLGDYNAATEALNDAVRLARRAGDRGLEGAASMTLGSVQYFRHRMQDAVTSYSDALDAARAEKDAKLESQALGNLGLAYTQLNQYDRAEEYFRQDIATAHARGDILDEAQALGNLGSMLVQQRRDADAIPLLARSRDMSVSVGYRRGEAIALRNLGLAQLRTGHPDDAEATLRQAIAVQEMLREQAAGADRYNISLLDTQLEAYAHLQASLIALHRPEAALEISERGRARALVSLLAAHAGGPAAPPGIDDIRAVATSRKVTIVEYSVVQANNAIFAWVVAPGGDVAFRRIGIDAHGGPIDAALGRLVRDTRATLGALGPRDVPSPKPGIAGRDDMLTLLYRLLISPIADLLPKSPEAPVVLIPQGQLFLLPFAALRDPAGHPFIEAHSLLVAPSIQTFGLLDRTRAASLAAALVMGNPVLGPLRLDPGSDVETQLPPLPEAAREAQAVASLLHARPLTGAAATKAAAVAAMPGAEVIHLATHGIAEDVRGKGLPGALALAASSRAHDGNDDGLLTSADIMALRLQAGLVVLSACNTGLGNISGDGVIGLSRAFLAAGARSVVVSLWYVPDQETSELMPAFYRALAHTRAKGVALRQAMLETRARHPDPLAWAGFLLIGDNE
jgi:tetratricopeptide (TPR) repeat protein